MGAERTSGERARPAGDFVGGDFEAALREAFRRWNEGDFEASTELMHPDVEWRTSRRFPDLAPVYHGREGMRRFWDDFTAPWDEIVLEPLRFEVAGDVAVVDTQFRARGRGGIEVDITMFNQFTRRDGLTDFVQTHTSREEAVAAAGLSKTDVDVVRAAFSRWDRPADVDPASLTEDDRRALVSELIGAAFDDGFHTDVEYREDPDWPGAATYRGIEQVKACFRDYAEMLRFDDSRVERVVDAAGRVVAVIRVAARPAGASEPVVHRWGYVCRVRDGKVDSFQAYLDPRRAFEAAGLEEPAS
jgi:ketosteroid isomerase-like protein